MLPKIHRYQQRREIVNVFRHGQWLNSGLISLLVYKNPQRKEQSWRLTVLVSKKNLSTLATERNRVKRQLTQAFYLTSKEFDLTGFDFCLTGKKNILTANFETITKELTKLLSKIKK